MNGNSNNNNNNNNNNNHHYHFDDDEEDEATITWKCQKHLLEYMFVNVIGMENHDRKYDVRYEKIVKNKNNNENRYQVIGPLNKLMQFKKDMTEEASSIRKCSACPCWSKDWVTYCVGDVVIVLCYS